MVVGGMMGHNGMLGEDGVVGHSGTGRDGRTECGWVGWWYCCVLRTTIHVILCITYNDTRNTVHYIQ